MNFFCEMKLNLKMCIFFQMDDVIDDIINMSNYDDQPYIDPVQMPNTVSRAK